MEAQRALHNLRTDHVMIRSELKYLIAVEVVGTANLELWAGSNPGENQRVYIRAREQPCQDRAG